MTRAVPAVPLALAERLRELHRSEHAAQPECWAAEARELAGDDLALVAALALGGSNLALRIAAAATGCEPAAEAATQRLTEALQALLEPHGADADHEQRVAQALCLAFALPTAAQHLPSLLRADLLIHAAPAGELPSAVLAAMRAQAWPLALQGVQRLRRELGERTPRDAYGLGAMCLHRLGRLAEADEWIRAGLGPQQVLLEIPPVFSEAELLQRWGDAADEPVVSIVCPTYNHERYLDQALRGFLSQDCPHPFEILIHDDASTDGTAAIVRDWQARYPRLIRAVLQTQNQFSRGVRPFELLLKMARGRYVATCEGDDFWIDAAKLRRQVDFLEAHPAFSCSAHNYLHFNETALTVRPWSRIGRDYVLNERALRRVHALLWLPTLVFRKTFDAMPPERDLAILGDQFLTSWLGTLGRCMYFETQHSAVRRENEFSLWSPLSSHEKERRRVVTWAALARLHARLGHRESMNDLLARIAESPLPLDDKGAILEATAAAPLAGIGPRAEPAALLEAAR